MPGLGKYFATQQALLAALVDGLLEVREEPDGKLVFYPGQPYRDPLRRTLEWISRLQVLCEYWPKLPVVAVKSATDIAHNQGPAQGGAYATHR